MVSEWAVDMVSMHRCVEYTISTGQTDMQLQNADRITCNINNSAVSSFASFLRSQTIPHFIVSLSTLHNFLSVVLEATSFIGLSSASQPLFVETFNPQQWLQDPQQMTSVSSTFAMPQISAQSSVQILRSLRYWRHQCTL